LDNTVTITVCCISTYLSSSLRFTIPQSVFLFFFPLPLLLPLLPPSVLFSPFLFHYL
jgi:hypothetical protein